MRDSAGHKYVEIQTTGGEYLRLTLIPHDDAGRGVNSIRVQVRANGRLRQGPEIPVEAIGQIASGVSNLLDLRSWIGG